MSPTPASPSSVRLEYEWRHLQRTFAYHPFVQVTPFDGDPPIAYHVQFKIRTLIVNEQGVLTYSDRCSVTVELPVEFPRVPPIIRPNEAIFHPNVDGELVQIFPAWIPDHSLADVVQRVGRLLAFQVTDPNQIVNPVAQEWVVANGSFIPTDAGANVSPDAGGKPLARISASGGATVAALREQLRGVVQSLLQADTAPADDEVRLFAQRTRLLAGLFLAGDIPEELADQADEVHAATAALPAALTVFERQRGMPAVAATARDAAAGLSAAVGELSNYLAGLDALVTEDPQANPAEALAQLPAAEALQRSLGGLRVALAKTDNAIPVARSHAAALASAIPAGLPELLAGPLEAGQRQLASAGSAAATLLQTTLSTSEPIVARARQELATLERLVWWREYADLVRRAARLTRQLTSAGPAAVQAYFMINPAGTHGPFEFEQQLDLGPNQIAVRLLERTGFELIDVYANRSLARAKESADLTFGLRGEEGEEPIATTFRCGARCDAMALQLSYAAKQTGSLLRRLTDPNAKPSYPASWTGIFLETLSTEEFHRTVIVEHASGAKDWQALAADLTALWPFKERIATYHLLVRLMEATPRLQAAREQTEGAIAITNDRLKPVLARGVVNVETGQAVIPARYRAEYESLVQQLERQEQAFEEAEAAWQLAAAHVKQRVGNRGTFGSAGLPRLTILGELPEEWQGYPAAMADEALLGLVRSLEQTFGVEFMQRRWEPTDTRGAPARQLPNPNPG